MAAKGTDKAALEWAGKVLQRPMTSISSLSSVDFAQLALHFDPSMEHSFVFAGDGDGGLDTTQRLTNYDTVIDILKTRQPSFKKHRVTAGSFVESEDDASTSGGRVLGALFELGKKNPFPNAYQGKVVLRRLVQASNKYHGLTAPAQGGQEAVVVAPRSAPRCAKQEEPVKEGPQPAAGRAPVKKEPAVRSRTKVEEKKDEATKQKPATVAAGVKRPRDAAAESVAAPARATSAAKRPPTGPVGKKSAALSTRSANVPAPGGKKAAGSRTAAAAKGGTTAQAAPAVSLCANVETNTAALAAMRSFSRDYREIRSAAMECVAVATACHEDPYKIVQRLALLLE